MAFFDDFKKTVTEIGQGASQKTKSFTDGVKINSQIGDQKKNLSKMYEDLGRMLYKEETTRSNPNCAQLLEWIDRGEQNLQSLEQQLSVSKGAVPCKNCGAPVPAGNAFCQNCGTRVEVQAQPQGNPQYNGQPMNNGWQQPGSQPQGNSQANGQPMNNGWQQPGSQPQGNPQANGQPMNNGWQQPGNQPQGNPQPNGQQNYNWQPSNNQPNPEDTANQ